MTNHRKILIVSESEKDGEMISTQMQKYQPEYMFEQIQSFEDIVEKDWSAFFCVLVDHALESITIKKLLTHFSSSITKPVIVYGDRSTHELSNEIKTLGIEKVIDKSNINYLIYEVEKKWLQLQLAIDDNTSTKTEPSNTCTSDHQKLVDQIDCLTHKLELKNKELEQVLYVSSHDIRSPLVNIVGFTNELSKVLEELTGLLNKEDLNEEDRKNVNYLIQEDIPEILKFINAGGVKIDKLLYGLLKLSRLGRSPIEMQAVNVDQLIEGILPTYKSEIEAKQITIIKDPLPEIITDRNLITQILTCLIDNSIKFSDAKKESYVKISAETQENVLAIQIEDNGVGISEDKIQVAFEMFNRLHPEIADGEGIGLTIVKKGMERLDGKVILKSKPDKGTTISIQIPRD